MNFNENKYTQFNLRKPPKNVKVMMVFWNGDYDVCYIDDWNILHGEKVRIYKNVTPKMWKKIEKDNWGEYKW